MWHYLLHNFILFCTTDDGWWFIWNMSWLNNMNFKNIVWFIKALFSCSFYHINILLPVFESAMVTRWTDIAESLNDKNEIQNQFKRCSYDNIVWNCDVKENDRKTKLCAPSWWAGECSCMGDEMTDQVESERAKIKCLYTR